MKNYWYLIAVLLLCNLSCAIDDDIMLDPCKHENLGTYSLLPTSDEAFPYVDFFSTTNFIYVNEEGEEITYNIDTLVAFNVLTLFRRPCQEDESVENFVSYSTGFKGVNLLCDDNPLILGVSLFSRLNFSSLAPESLYDMLSISARDEPDGISYKIFSMVVDARESDQSLFGPDFYESIEINDRTLLNVYQVYNSNPIIDANLYYSKELGIVAFNDLDSVQWVLDRIE